MKLDKYIFVRYVVAFLCLCFLLTVNVELIDKPKKREINYFYTQAQKKLDSFGKCDTAGGFVYFTYRSGRSLVAVYDMKGNYLQTIEFTDFNNGDIYIRREQGKLILKLRNDNVFVLKGKEVIAIMTQEEADRTGYTDNWFKNAEKRYEVTENAIRVRNEEGDVCTFQLSKDRIASNRVMRLVVGFVAIIVAVFIKKRIRKTVR